MYIQKRKEYETTKEKWMISIIKLFGSDQQKIWNYYFQKIQDNEE